MSHDLTILHELANIGAGHACTALSQLFGRTVMMTPPEVLELSLSEAIAVLHPDEEEVSAALLHLEGELSGLVVIATADGGDILESVGMAPGGEVDLISETGNIVAARLADAIGNMTAVIGRPTPPAAALIPRSSVVEAVLALTAQNEPFVMSRSQISLGSANLDLMFFPDSPVIARLEALG